MKNVKRPSIICSTCYIQNKSSENWYSKVWISVIKIKSIKTHFKNFFPFLSTCENPTHIIHSELPYGCNSFRSCSFFYWKVSCMKELNNTLCQRLPQISFLFANSCCYYYCQCQHSRGKYPLSQWSLFRVQWKPKLPQEDAAIRDHILKKTKMVCSLGAMQNEKVVDILYTAPYVQWRGWLAGKMPE